MEKTVALILAGGRGKRMNVLCYVRPKPALPFAGKFKVIDFTLSNCVYSGISDLAILIDYQRSHMAKYLRQWGLANAVGTFHILEPKVGSYKDTADAVYQNLPYLNKLDSENVLILPSDQIYRLDYREMLSFHKQQQADMSVAVTAVPIEQANRFGNIRIGAGGRVSSYIEKPASPISNLASMGIFLFDKQVLTEYLIEDAQRKSSQKGFERGIIPALLDQGGRVFAYRFNEYWQDIGTPQAYYDANMELVCTQPSFSLNGTRKVLTQHLNMPPPNINQQGMVLNSLLSPGCVIRGRVENSILSPGVCINEQAEVRNSVLMPNVSVGYHSIVDICIVDEDVNIGKLCYIGFGKSPLLRDFDITVIGKGVIIPPYTAIGHNCTVFPLADISNLRGNLILSGSNLSQHGVIPKSCVNEEVERNERKGIRVT